MIVTGDNDKNSKLIKEIYELFNKLEDFQIRRVPQFIGMEVNSRPPKYINSGNATTDIVEWAEKNDKLDELKSHIEDTLGKKNLNSKEPSKQSQEEKILKILSSLDSKEQVQIFCKVLNLQSRGVFLVRASQEKTKTWLVYQLLLRSNRFERARKITIRLKLSPARESFDKLCYEILRGLLPIFEPYPSNFMHLVETLKKLNQTQSIVITIYSPKLLTHEIRKEFYELWRILWKDLSKSNYFILLLVENIDCRENELEPFTYVSSTDVRKCQEDIFLLKPLEEILQIDLNRWVEEEEELKSYRCLDYLESSVKDIKTTEPSEVLENICEKIFVCNYTDIHKYLEMPR